MIQFQKPVNLNGDELLNELFAVGIVLDKWKQAPSIDGEGVMWLDIAEDDKAKAAPIVAAHNGTIVAPDTSAAKAALLARLGMTADEAKLLLS
jgi:hypothetical protein